jgi:tetratricopeptide (TPR) repeat protein
MAVIAPESFGQTHPSEPSETSQRRDSMPSEDVFECADPIVHYLFANDFARRQRYQSAIQHYEHAIALDPNHLDSEVYFFAAWLLATCPIESLRDGARAVELASIACNQTEWSEWQPLAILAASYAAAGDFQKAIDALCRALELAAEDEFLRPEDQATLESDMQLLKAGKLIPYR